MPYLKSTIPHCSILVKYMHYHQRETSSDLPWFQRNFPSCVLGSCLVHTGRDLCPFGIYFPRCEWFRQQKKSLQCSRRTPTQRSRQLWKSKQVSHPALPIKPNALSRRTHELSTSNTRIGNETDRRGVAIPGHGISSCTGGGENAAVCYPRVTPELPQRICWILDNLLICTHRAIRQQIHNDLSR